jgi:hypothetical protein
MTDFTITEEQRRELLESHNELKDALHTIWECHDVWMSDIANLEGLMSRLQRTFKFEQPSGGHPYMKWVLEEDNPPKEE